MIALSVNLNKIALLRNSRDGDYPRLLDFAQQCLDLGVQGITVHPRPDQRHIRPQDVCDIAALIRNFNHNNSASVEFNIEGNPFAPPIKRYPGLLALVEETFPDQCTLVPDSDTQLTSDHGFDLTRDTKKVEPILRKLSTLGVRSSVFMDPNERQIKLAALIGAERIELYTGPFAWAYDASKEEGMIEFEKHCQAAVKANELGLEINAGHDLNLNNMLLYRQLPGLKEVSIGHSLTVDALRYGWKNTIQKYLSICTY